MKENIHLLLWTMNGIFLWWWCNYREFIMLLVYFRKSNKQTPFIPIIASIGSWLKFNFCLDIFGRMLLFNKISGCCSRALCFGLKSRFLTRVRAWFEKKNTHFIIEMRVNNLLFRPKHRIFFSCQTRYYTLVGSRGWWPAINIRCRVNRPWLEDTHLCLMEAGR